MNLFKVLWLVDFKELMAFKTQLLNVHPSLKSEYMFNFKPCDLIKSLNFMRSIPFIGSIDFPGQKN